MIHDITPPITAALAVWPGDTRPTREVLLDMQRGDNLTLSTLRATVHLGAHADAPSHYGADAPTIETRSLTPYLGPAQLIRVAVKRGQHIHPDQLPETLQAERVLLSTETFPDPQQFNQDFAALSVELIDSLHLRGVKLIGIDTPSVDLFDSRDLPAHQACLRHDLSILEGLVLPHSPLLDLR